MDHVLKYVVTTLAFVVVSSGILVATCLDIYEADVALFFCALIPLVLLFMGGVVVNERFAVPRLLLHKRYFAYCGVTFLTAYIIIILALGYEHLGREVYGLPQRISDFSSGWVFIDCIGNCSLVFMMFLGLGVWQLFESWQKEMATERHIADNLSHYIKAVKTRLNPSHILGCISDISLARNAQSTVEGIQILSAYLRHQLYELPAPPRSGFVADTTDGFSSLSGFLVGDRWRVWRHVIFQAMLLLIVFDVFFDAPDRPRFTADRVLAMLSELALLDAIAYVNILFLYRSFKRHHNLRRYLRDVSILIVAILLPMIVVQILTYKPTLYTYSTPLGISLLAALSSMTTLSMFVAGVTAVLLLQDWISGRRRITMLRAETARQEYAFLRKQINPHFIFNVLNNVGILAEDDPEDAAYMLSELHKLIEYQFAETDSNTTTLGREIGFLRSYLSLESSRIEPFSYDIASPTDAGETVIPTLLFITFVENAVKYSAVVDGKRVVRLSFAKVGDSLRFRCENTFRRRPAPTDHRCGLGIANTLRRLNLLYADSYTYTHNISSGHYVVELTIPCSIQAK